MNQFRRLTVFVLALIGGSLVMFSGANLATRSLLSAQSVEQAQQIMPDSLAQTVQGIMTPIIVRDIPNLHTEKGERALGISHLHAREIHLLANLHAGFREAILRHERCHFALFDFSIGLPDEIEEHVCDAIAAGLR